MNLVESGIIKHLCAKDLPNAEICPQDLGGTERQLRNGDLMMTYYIMFAGFATSIVVFSTEIIFRFLNSRQESNKWARHGIGRTPDGHSFMPSRWQRLRSDSGSDKQRLTHHYGNSNVTPPPPYQSIFSSHNGRGNGGVVGGHGGHGVGNLQQNMLSRWHQQNGNSTGGRSPPMAGKESEASGVRRFINGREYMVFRNANGQSQLVPMRVPSATLFQYTYTE